jgi:Fe-S cluster assembly protein SufD
MTTELAKQTIYDADFKRSLVESGQPIWLKSIRRQAFKFFTENGFPTMKNEEWKYTNTAPIAREEFSLKPGGVDENIVRNFIYKESAENTLVFIDGILNREFSRTDNTFTALTLNEAFKDETTVKTVEESFGKAADFGKNGFTALNAALLREGLFLQIPENIKIEAPIHLLFISTQGKVSFPRLLVHGEKFSQATIIESYVSAGEGRSFTNSVAEFFLEDEARLAHFRVQKENPESFNIGTTQAVLGRASNYDSTNINLGAALSRHDTGVKFTAEGAECFVDGLYMLNGSQHADTHSVIDHAVPHCASHQNYKGVLSDRSHAVFNGKVFVREDARGTDAQQSNKNLLLSNEARVDTKPQLEIFNDDVKCAHGATVGQLEDEEIFYLLSRGIHPELARNLLTYGFAEEVISKIEIGSIKAELDEAVLNRLAATLEV